MSALHALAAAAGIAIRWRDVNGADHVVSDDSLRAVLAAIDFPAGSEAEIADSLATLQREAGRAAPALITAFVGDKIHLPGEPGPFRAALESGHRFDGKAEADGDGVVIPGIDEPGYHEIELGGAVLKLAVAPRRAFTIGDAAHGRKLWGLTVQLYGLRRDGDGGIGDYAALEAFAAHACKHGASAIGISPAHALFSADVNRFGPYAPSNRAALNVLHIAADTDAPDSGDLVDWPAAAAAKLRALRAQFDANPEYAALAAFRAGPGRALETHAVFEALAANLVPGNPEAQDWRRWPAAYQSPGSPAVARFILETPHEIAFHAWLQFQADKGLAAAQAAAKSAGAPIGLIADLAVGTDHAGSHSWSRQDEVLKGLEIGAPPDLINREGQSWGITAFSPRGLRKSGFAAFINMLRHALRHAGGVRIDHVMGLARLWVIPQGFSSAEGAYLALPVDDLMRLVTLESHRHRAVILGEDLGTLPDGFGDKLNHAGIAGLRVMWFERRDAAFTSPATWTPSAVAMTTTHDLPTVAGWWEGRDIAWRQKLGMQGESEAERAADRTALWRAFQDSGATAAPEPPAEDGAAVTYIAAAHLGRSACALALLPVEDALSLPEQPNLPGTVDEHPNWRRRLPGDAASLFAREDFLARMAVLAQSREHH